jgi:hypothetical protein
MAVADRTFSFRAPRELGKRMEQARASLERFQAVADEQVDAAAWLASEFELALLRRLPALASARGQSAFMRAAMETLVAATEKVERELERMPALKDFDRHDREGEQVRAAMLDATATGWR